MTTASTQTADGSRNVGEEGQKGARYNGVLIYIRRGFNNRPLARSWRSTEAKMPSAIHLGSLNLREALMAICKYPLISFVIFEASVAVCRLESIRLWAYLNATPWDPYEKSCLSVVRITLKSSIRSADCRTQHITRQPISDALRLPIRVLRVAT